MQALESLNDSQVNDFLSGKTPLNLSMRLGDHMMLIQLQLSTVNPIGQNGSMSSSNSNSHHHHHHHHHHVCGYQRRSSLRASTNQLLTEHQRNNQEKLQQLKVQQQQKMQQQKDKINNQEIGQNLCRTHHSSQPERPPTSTQNFNSEATTTSKISADCVDGADKNEDSADLKPRRPLVSGVKRAGSPVSGPFKKSDLSAFFEKHDVKSLQSIVKNFNSLSKSTNIPITGTVLEQSPIKSLSNLVSNSTKPSTSMKNIPKAATSTKPHSSTRSSHAFKGNLCACQESLTSRLTSCLCKRLHSATKNMLQSRSNSSNPTTMAIPNSKSSALNAISICKLIDTEKVSAAIDSAKKVVEKKDMTRNAANHFVPLNNNISLKQCLEANNIQMPMRPTQSSAPLGLLRICNHNSKEPTTGTNIVVKSVTDITDANAAASNALHKTANNTINRAKQFRHQHQIQQLSSSAALAFEVGRNAQVSPRLQAAAMGANKTTTDTQLTAATTTLDESLNSITDTRTLAEASRNLTQTLRKLSKEVFTNKIDLTATNEEIPRKTGSGAVIESMKNHGKGIYSGTFSGTLNPALQDRYGRPKRDISTVIHILNDLLSATPQYSRGARISLEAPAAVGPLSATTSNNFPQSSKNKQFTLKPYHPCLKCLKSVHHIQHMPNGAVCSTSDCERVKRHSATLSCCIDAGNNAAAVRPEGSQKERLCTCRYRMTEAGEREREQMCQKCVVEMENSKTKSKLDQLRLVMQQRKQKREARKLKESPYATRTTSPATSNVGSLQKTELPNIMASTNATILTPTKATLATSSPAAANNAGNAASGGSEVPPNHIVEEVDTAA